MDLMLKTVILCLCLVLLLVGGCAPPPAPTDRQLRQTIDELRQVQQQQARQLEQLAQKLATLQQAPESKPPSLPDIPESSLPVEASETENANARVQSSAEIVALTESSALYLQAFGALATGRFASAAQSFRTFIDRYPHHEFSGNARYWLAEALIAQQDDVPAETVLLEIVESPQEQQRAAAAMARLIDIYQKRGATEQARATLQQLSRRYPASTELHRFTNDPTLF